MGNLNEDFVKLPDYTSATVVRKKFCVMCGSVLEYRDSVFSYQEKRWLVRFPVCPSCSPDRDRDDA